MTGYSTDKYYASMSDNDLIWLAGLLEGEGCFLHGPPSKPRAPIIKVSMTDEDVVIRVAALFGARCCPLRRDIRGKEWKPVWLTRLHGSRAVVMMRAVFPYMGARRRVKICEVIDRYETLIAEASLPTHATSTSAMDEHDLMWLAGLLEGEGSFMHGPPSDHRRPIIALMMSDEDVVARVAAMFGVRHHQVRKDTRGKLWKPVWAVQIRGSSAVEMMRKLLPHMGHRRSQKIRDVVARYEVLKAEVPVSKLTLKLAMRIRARWTAGERNKSKLGRVFGVTRNTVRNVILGNIYEAA